MHDVTRDSYVLSVIMSTFLKCIRMPSPKEPKIVHTDESLFPLKFALVVYNWDRRGKYNLPGCIHASRYLDSGPRYEGHLLEQVGKA